MQATEAQLVVIGHLLSLRAVTEAQLRNVDICLKSVAGIDPVPAADEAATAECQHAHRINITPAGTTTERWFCPDCNQEV